MRHKATMKECRSFRTLRDLAFAPMTDLPNRPTEQESNLKSFSHAGNCAFLVLLRARYSRFQVPKILKKTPAAQLTERTILIFLLIDL